MSKTRLKSAQTLESLMTPRQVSDFLQVSIFTIRRWTRNNQLKGYRLGRQGNWRYKREDVLTSLHTVN